MIKTKIYPDFITIDGSEGGTGATSLESCNYVGMPLEEGIILVNNCLVGTGLRKHIRLIAAGKIVSSFDILTKMALGADILNSARGMMFALGCIQFLGCHLNTCPTGITTQDPRLRYALHIKEKATHVKNFQGATLRQFLTLLGAAGFDQPEDLHPSNLRPSIVFRRISKEKILRYDQIFDILNEEDILNNKGHLFYENLWEHASADRFITQLQLIEETY